MPNTEEYFKHNNFKNNLNSVFPVHASLGSINLRQKRWIHFAQSIDPCCNQLFPN